MEKSQTVGQRFSELIAHLGISKNAFALSLDKTATVIQHLVDERNKPGFDLLCKVFEVYPNVSKDWLLEGKGGMLLTSATQPTTTALPAPVATIPAQNAVPPAPASRLAAPENEVEQPGAVEPPAPAVVPDEPIAPPAPAIPAVPPVAVLPVASPAAAEAGWQAALYTQQMAHQLALAELRNQHLLEQQRLMQQMMELLQKQMAR